MMILILMTISHCLLLGLSYNILNEYLSTSREIVSFISRFSETHYVKTSCITSVCMAQKTINNSKNVRTNCKHDDIVLQSSQRAQRGVNNSDVKTTKFYKCPYKDIKSDIGESTNERHNN